MTEDITVQTILSGGSFLFVLIIFFLACLKRVSRTPPKYNPKEGERASNHRNKKTLVIPAGEKATDDNQVLYFSVGKGFVDPLKKEVFCGDCDYSHEGFLLKVCQACRKNHKNHFQLKKVTNSAF